MSQTGEYSIYLLICSGDAQRNHNLTFLIEITVAYSDAVFGGFNARFYILISLYCY